MSTYKDAKEAFETSEHPDIVVEGAELIEKYKDVDKEGITNLAEFFFTEEGYPLGAAQKLSITFLDFSPTTGNPVRDRAHGMMVYREESEDGFNFGDIAIFMPNIEKSGKSGSTALAGRAALVTTLLHEMAHVVQKFRGMEFDYTLKYAERPHEIEAGEKVISWTKKANKILRKEHIST